MAHNGFHPPIAACSDPGSVAVPYQSQAVRDRFPQRGSLTGHPPAQPHSCEWSPQGPPGLGDRSMGPGRLARAARRAGATRPVRRAARTTPLSQDFSSWPQAVR